MNIEIFTINVGMQEFSDEQHLKNFAKYLFSCSKGHSTNADTEHNLYGYSNSKERRVGFIDDAKRDLKDFNSFFKNEYKDWSRYVNTLHYAFFIMETENKVITNIFSVDGDEVQVLLPNEFIEHIIKTNFNGEESLLIDRINQLLKPDNEFVYYKDAKLEERAEFECAIHNKIRKETSSIISISHNDQDDFLHLHSIIRIIS